MKEKKENIKKEDSQEQVKDTVVENTEKVSDEKNIDSENTDESLNEDQAGNTDKENKCAEDIVDDKETEEEKEEEKEEGKEKEKEKVETEVDYKAKYDEANDKYIRLAAEFDNFRRRTAKERLDLISTASEDTIVGILPVLDDFERAIKVMKENKPEDKEDKKALKATIEGIELIYNKLFKYLKSKGVSVIECKGKELDTDYHEAVAQFPVKEKKQKNKIYDVVQTGYMLNGKVIRFAKVVVGI